MADTGRIRQVGQGDGHFVGNDAPEQFGIRRRHCSRSEGQRFNVFVDRQILQRKLFEASQTVWSFGEELEGPGQSRSERVSGKGLHRGPLIVRNLCFVCGEFRVHPLRTKQKAMNNANVSLAKSDPCCATKCRSAGETRQRHTPMHLLLESRLARCASSSHPISPLSWTRA